MASYNKAVKKTEEANAVSAETVEVGISNEVYGMDMEKCLQKIAKRYPDRHFAWVDKKESGFKHNRWVYLEMINEGTDVAVTKERDKAEQRGDNILCWRERKYQDQVDAQIRALNIRSIQISRQQNTQRQSEEINNEISGLGIAGIKATPLSDID